MSRWGRRPIGCEVPPQTRIPIGWVAVGDPARLYPPGEAGNIRAGLEEAGGFLPFVFGTGTAAGRSQQMRSAMRRYAGSCPVLTTAMSQPAKARRQA